MAYELYFKKAAINQNKREHRGSPQVRVLGCDGPRTEGTFYEQDTQIPVSKKDNLVHPACCTRAVPQDYNPNNPKREVF